MFDKFLGEHYPVKDLYRRKPLADRGRSQMRRPFFEFIVCQVSRVGGQVLGKNFAIRRKVFPFRAILYKQAQVINVTFYRSPAQAY
jgi:hypothetical protein